MPAAQLRAGVDAEFVGEQAGAPVVAGQGVGAAAAAVQRDHQVPDELLAERMFGDQCGQLVDELPVPAERQFVTDALLPQGQPQVVQPGRGGLDHPAADAGQRRSAPLGERGAQQVGRAGPVVAEAYGVPGGGHVALHPGQVELVGSDTQEVPAALGDQNVHLRRPQPAQFRDPVTDLVAAGGRRPGVPHRLDQPLDRDDPVGLQQQHRQYLLLARAAARQPGPTCVDL